MSIYNIARVRELAIDRMKNDLEKYGYTKGNTSIFVDDEDYEDFFSFTPQQSNQYMAFMGVVKNEKEWTFHTDETVDEAIIEPHRELRRMYSEDFDIEECLEEAKVERYIEGFFKLDGVDRIWLIKERD